MLCCREKLDVLLKLSGICIVTNLEGYDGEKITWKSSCGGYAYTILDGNNGVCRIDCLRLWLIILPIFTMP